MDKTNALSLRGNGTFRNGPTLTYLIDDEFTDTLAAGSVNGTAATPGPGTRTVTDTENKLSVGSGVLALAGGKASPAYGDPGIWYAAQSKISGLATYHKFTQSANGYAHVGWDSNQAGVAETLGVWIANGVLKPVHGYLPNIGSFSSISNGQVWESFAVVLEGNVGAIITRVSGGDWKLQYIGAPSTLPATLYPAVSSYNGTIQVDAMRVIALPAPFDTDDGIATDVLSGSVSAGTTFTHEADMLLEFTVDTLPSAGNIRVRFRYQDSSNFWYVLISSGGNFALYEIVGGGSTNRAVTVGSVANGHRVVIVADGTIIKGYSNDTLFWTYSNAELFQTATAGEMNSLDTGGAVSDLKTWPRELDGIAASVLNKASA